MEPTLPPLHERTLDSVIRRRLETSPDSPMARDASRSASCAQLFEEAMSIAGGLAERGIEPGENVLLMLDNHVDYIVAWFAIGLTGRIEVPVNTAYKRAILTHVLNNSSARAIIIDKVYLETLDEIADTLTTLELVIVRDEERPKLNAKFDVMTWKELHGPPASIVKSNPWDLMGILYTSGTTGPSKGVRVTHAHAYGYSSPVNLHISRTPEDISLCDLPLFHIGGQWAIVYNVFIAGGATAIFPRFSASSYWQNARDYGCTSTMMLGAVANFLFRQPPSADDKNHKLRRVFMVPVVPQLEEFKERFGIPGIATGYGLTEGSTIMRTPEGKARPGHCGWPRPDFEIRLVDEHDQEVKDGEAGELCVRTKEPWMVMDGYHNMPEATVSAWRNQWLHTGDGLRRDLEGDGQYIFIDRMKDAVRRRGENVSSFEVEKEINEHPAVLESAVVAFPSDATEDEIRACVVLRAGQKVEAEELLVFLDARLPDFMVPRYVDFLVEMPKTPTEKIRKAALREQGISPTTYDREVTRPRKKK